MKLAGQVAGLSDRSEIKGNDVGRNRGARRQRSVNVFETVASDRDHDALTRIDLTALVLGEPIGLNVIVGIVAVFIGIWLASTNARKT